MYADDITKQNSDELSEASGIVDSIIYQNEENGYTVCEIESSSGDPIVVTGIIPYLAEGDKITVRGRWTNHQVYGRQFKAETYEKSLPADEGDILRYLASGAIKGIGPKTAQKIVEKFGTDSFDVIENHPEWLTAIPGVSPKKAAAIGENFRSISGARAVMMFCRDYFTPQTAMKIYGKWGNASVDKIRRNPYRLCEDFWGISFTRADQIAMSIGLTPDSDERISHGLSYILRHEASKSGHTCLPKADLVRCAVELLFGGDESYKPAVESVLAVEIARSKLVETRYALEEYVFDHLLYNAEKYVAEKLTAISRLCPRMDNRDIRLLLEKCERACGIEFATSQIRALTAAMSNGVMILTGGPGTGKTTIVRGLISIFDSLDMKVSLAAPTGRAAKRMSEATQAEAKTIHRLLEVDFSDESGKRFLRDEDNTLDADVLIVDEASMIDVELMSSLLCAMKNGSRLILIGDIDQLPSVGAGNVLGDIIASEKFTVIRLTQIFRQSEKSLIIKNAHRINEGLLPDTADKSGDFFFLPREGEEAISATVIDLVRNRLPRTYGEDIIRKIQVITPSKKGLSGTDTLNEGLQAALNPPSPRKAERRRGAVIFREGDRVMQTKNNYQIEWKTDDGRNGMGIYNGDIGDVIFVDHEENTVTVRFDERECTLDSAQLDEIEHAYAITVHKSQGSEYPVVIIPLYSCAPMLMSRNLLYTAVTRGAKMVILVGRSAVLERMVENEHHANRCTMLKEFLEDK